jgi:hypothetical protein
MSRTPRMLRTTMIFIPAAYLALAIGLTVVGMPLARFAPGLLTYFSFRDGPFAWSYEVRNGTVTPFKIGNSRDQVWETIKRCRCFMIYPGGELPRMSFGELAPAQLTDLTHRDNLMVSRQNFGSPVLYQLTFEHDDLAVARISSSAFAGL